ncbi:hypothetical protein QR680_004609 [Steinernema hermaphroditum]|uniref:Uncharacterized protein n=1 Tax=Steinernema hermaphroditum TaxID=289476 RepID=A0AA39HRG1_9BILA|nr:hypothetical protein QR680_004609 [Steinernema hermaphroditum]
MSLQLLFLFGLTTVSAFSCKDQNNDDVDWWFAYKMPKMKKSNGIQGLAEGVAFYYLDANNPVFSPSQVDLAGEDQAIGYTLKQFYDSKEDPSVFHVLYNDDPPDERDELNVLRNSTEEERRVNQYGHTKGVSFFDNRSGVWYIHSVPRFPSPGGYHYPDSAKLYGQSMLCISLKYDQLADVGSQLFFNRPIIYSSQLPPSMALDNPNLAKIIVGKYKKGAPTSSVIDLQSKGGRTFRSFAKSGEFGDDIYSNLIAPNLKTNLTVETWRRGSPISKDCSSRYLVADALEMKVGDLSEFKYTRDHSKVAVSDSTRLPYTCVGDINRMTSQFFRGGGTVCLLDKNVWNAYIQLIKSVESCGA